MIIKDIYAREVIDSRGNPTIEAEVKLESGVTGRAIVPSGASTGAHEALELRDKDPKRFSGKGVRKAISHVEGEIKKALVGLSVSDPTQIDRRLLDLDGTENKSRLGANAILSVSLASAWASANQEKTPLYMWIKDRCGFTVELNLPIPLMNVINGGAHANNSIDFQEFMLVPWVEQSFSRSLQAGVEVFHSLKKILDESKHSTSVGDEGGFAPNLKSNREALEILTQATEKAGYRLGHDISFALDVASTEFYKEGFYNLENEREAKFSKEKLLSLYENLCRDFPIVSIEDGMAEDDWTGWKILNQTLGASIQLVGDDLFVTNTKRIKTGFEKKAANAVLIKVNQIGTLTETFEAMKLSKTQGWRSIVSHRSGETEDITIAHIAVGTGSGQIKTGSASRTDRIAKYNELLRIEDNSRRQGRSLKLADKFFDSR